MSNRSPVLLLDGQTRQPISADLIEGMTLAEIRRTDALWTPFLKTALADALANGLPLDALPEHAHWQWERKWRVVATSSRFLGIERDGAMQALMIVRTDKACRLPAQFGLPLVYVDYLAVAPWNLPELVPQPRFRRGGLALLAAAVRLSDQIGYNGRIGLHSMPQAEEVYRAKCGMSDLGVDPFYEDLHYLETTPEQSQDFLHRTN